MSNDKKITVGQAKIIAETIDDELTQRLQQYDEEQDAERDAAIENALENIGGAAKYSATIGTSWTENSNTGVKSQFVAIDGILETSDAIVDVPYIGDESSSSYSDFVEQQNQFLKFITNGYAETVEGGIVFCIFGDANTINIPIVVEVL